MTVLTKSLVCILLLFSFVGMIIGYAAISDNLGIYGDAAVEGKPFVGVYIYESEVYSINGVNAVSSNHYHPTNFSAVTNAPSANTSITYRLTLHNNSHVTYWYLGTDFVTSVESNSLINASGGITIMTKDHPSDNYSSFNTDDWIPSQTYRDVYVTYTFGAQATGYKATLVNYSFGVKMDSVHDEFLSVVNDNSLGGGYDQITAAFDAKYKETGSHVIANVGDEKEVFDSLFGSNLSITVDGVEVPVTVMIRRENVDGRTTGDAYSAPGGGSGCEYTVYISVDALNSPNGKAMVYAVSYSSGGAGGSGKWYQLGQLYEGTANVIDYDSTSAGVQGAFDVYSWSATPNSYEAAGIVYLVGQEQGDQYDKLKTLEQIMSTNDQDIFNDIDNKGIFKRVYDIVSSSHNTSKPGYAGLREAFDAAAPFYNIYNGGQEIKVKRNCTRAEILPYLENIQKALDYYNEVN